MSARYLAVSSVDDGATEVPCVSLERALRISSVPMLTRSDIWLLAFPTFPAASVIHPLMVVKVIACSRKVDAAVPYPPDTAWAVFPCSSAIALSASVADCA
ncbi:Uncharacterised protein [Mycobacteroides abscessus subsp. abscessus]|nr:Uncharacterised protein [Mycobacteroides abscessus subsp. abscessus]